MNNNTVFYLKRMITYRVISYKTGLLDSRHLYDTLLLDLRNDLWASNFC